MPISLRISTVVALLVLAGAASMASANEVLFSCTTTNGKPVQLSQSGDTLHYRFGAANKPELVFSNRTADIENGSCNSGNSSHSWVLLRNGGYDYMISAHDQTGKPSQATLDVYRSNAKTSSATLVCRSGSVRHQLNRLSDIILPCSQ